MLSWEVLLRVCLDSLMWRQVAGTSRFARRSLALGGFIQMTGSWLGQLEHLSPVSLAIHRSLMLPYVVSGIPHAARDSKPQQTFTFHIAAYIIVGNVPLTKANNMAKPRVNAEDTLGKCWGYFFQQGLPTTLLTLSLDNLLGGTVLCLVQCSAVPLASTYRCQ